MNKEQLKCALQCSKANVDFVYSNPAADIYSTLDHFILTNSIYDNIISYQSLCEDVDNQSDHVHIIEIAVYRENCLTQLFLKNIRSVC